VDGEKRKLYARIHSAGHLLDIAVSKAGLTWVPGKGYHFADAPYVEYVGSLDGLNLENIRKCIQEECDRLIKGTEGGDARKVYTIYIIIQVVNLTPLEYEQKLGTIPEYLKTVEEIRYVELCEDDKGCPCGGTHVEHVSEISTLNVTKIVKKGKNVRVCYNVA
jgi:Ser-tRNA(Ala) deacylase AlaX